MSAFLHPSGYVHGYEGRDYPCEHPASGACRPVVVIDPEDREQVERLTRAYWRTANDLPTRQGIDNMQKVLREFANPKPPKPDEPQGLGAVVEDGAGLRYIRSERHEDAPWDRFREYVGGFLWSDIDAVRVLSEGVQP